MRRWGKPFASACLFLAFAAVCSAEPITIGAALPLSGPNATAGQIQKNSLLMAAEEVNGLGGIRGRPLQLEIRDTAGRPDAARSLFESFVRNRNYPLVLAGASSRDVAEMARLSDRMGVPLLVAGAARDAITSPGYGNTFRLNPPLSRYPSGVLEFASRFLPGRRVALLAERTPYGDLAAEQVRLYALQRALAAPVVVRYEAAEPNLQAALEAVREAQPEIVFLASFPPDAIRLVEGLKEAGMRGAKVAGLSPYFSTAAFGMAAGEAAEGVFAAALWTPAAGFPGSERYSRQYLERYGHEPGYHGAEAFAAVQVASEALKNADDMTPHGVRKALEGTAALTVFGPVSFPSWDSFRNQNRARTIAMQWVEGRARVVWPEELASPAPILGSRP